MQRTTADQHPPPAGAHLTIGDFARRSQLSPKALRLYDRQGLLVPAEVDARSGYRFYTEDQLVTARLISRLRQLDMPLAIVSSIVEQPPDRQADLLAHWWDDLETRFNARRELMTWLLISLSGRDVPAGRFSVTERDVPAMTVLCEQRHVNAIDLPDWLANRTAYLVDIALQHGGVANDVFVIYHGEVSEDSNGPVEICVPVDGDQAAGLLVPTRVEPAHQEAFTPLRKQQAAWPQILTAYDAIEQWVVMHQREVKGPPRETYAPTFHTAAPDEQVLDVAYPIAAQ